MKFETVAKNMSTVNALKRSAGAYVIDFRTLSNEELIEALIKTAPQYYFYENVHQTIEQCIYNEDQNIRRLMPIIIKTILLNKDDFKLESKKTNEEVLKFEQSIINQSNEFSIKKYKARAESLELFTYILKVSWERGQSISVDEKNLILKIQEKLGVSEEEYMLLEAKLGNFPKLKNTLHSNDEITKVKRDLQKMGLIFKVRDDDGVDYDVIPEEIAMTLRKLFGLEIRKQGYDKLIENKRFRSKQYLQDTIEKSELIFHTNTSLPELKSFIVNNIKPTNLLGGYSPRDGFNTTELSKWAKELDLKASGTKDELIERIIDYYDNYKEKQYYGEDARKVYFEHYELLAGRKNEELRKLGILSKDNECEKYFEKATDYIFETLFNIEPLNLIGTKHPDGVLSFGDKFIMWDNKSKETDVNLKDHINQFDEYIRSSDKPVASFLVVGPSFTESSVDEAMKYQLLNDTVITLITAEELKSIALKWCETNDGKPFPLGYFKQPGRFNSRLVSY